MEKTELNKRFEAKIKALKNKIAKVEKQVQDLQFELGVWEKSAHSLKE